MAHVLASLEIGDSRPAMATIKRWKEEPKCSSSGPVPAERLEAYLAVIFGEMGSDVRDVLGIMRHFKNLNEISVFADIWTEVTRVGCAGWKVRASEIYADNLT